MTFGLWALILFVIGRPVTQLSGKQSVKRGSVGSAFRLAALRVNLDPTLPRFGTDCLPLS